MTGASGKPLEREGPEAIDLRGGALCLDFANSVDWDAGRAHVSPDLTDVLTTPARLATWGRRLGVPATAGCQIDLDELAAARALRDALHRLFSAVAAGAQPARADVETLEASEQPQVLPH